MVNGEVKNTSSTPVVSITNPSIDSTSPSNSSGGKQVSVVSLKIPRPYDYIQVFSESAIFCIVLNCIKSHLLTNATSLNKKR